MSGRIPRIEIIADAHAAGVRNRDADIRRAWKTAHPQGDRPQASWTRTLATKPNPPPTFPHYVRDMVASGGNEATSADLLALSPFAVPKDARAQTVAFLRSMFDPADNLYIFRDDVPSTGKIGTNLMPCCDWLATIKGGDATPGDLVVPNPFTGAEGRRTGDATANGHALAGRPQIQQRQAPITFVPQPRSRVVSDGEF